MRIKVEYHASKTGLKPTSSFPTDRSNAVSLLPGTVRSQAKDMKPGLQHKFGNLTLFSRKTCSDDIKWAGARHFQQDDLSAKQ